MTDGLEEIAIGALYKEMDRIKILVPTSQWYLFGSITTAKRPVGDIDVLVVCETAADCASVRTLLTEVCAQFPIHLFLTTLREEAELKFIRGATAVKITTGVRRWVLIRWRSAQTNWTEMKKRKPPKAPKAIAKSPQAVAVSRDQPEGQVWGWIKKLGLIGAALGLIFTVLRFLPQISIEPTAAAEASNPISGYFKITNEQAYSLTDVGIEVSLRCARIGRGDNTAPMDKCMPSMHTSKQLWIDHTLEPHEPYEITPGDLIFVTPGALLYAQISFFVSYKPWKIPYHLNKELRFESRRRSDGKIEWLHIPAD